jgi:anthranilate synthase/aminodeoxychorismate synthase-like glutamine amidotransferase
VRPLARPLRPLLVDAFDSFVHIIRQYLFSAGAEPVVVRSNALSHADIAAMDPDAIVLGPGPGHPGESGHVEIVREFGHRIPTLGVCLGHQAIGMAFGATVRPTTHLMHGKTSRISHDAEGVFAGVPAAFSATRYHSLVVVEKTVPPELVVSARADDDGHVMALRHRWLPVESLQFHPESVCTEHGLRLIENFLDAAANEAGLAARRSA